jgi:hypothetical protein
VSEAAEFDDMRMNPFLVVLILLSLISFAIAAPNRGNPFIAGNEVTWPTLGTNENSSMPLGNGDVALNVWTEQNGDIVLLNCEIRRLERKQRTAQARPGTRQPRA